MPGYLLYGANGYTGQLIARLAVTRGQRPILAGRNAASVDQLAATLQLPARSFSLDDPASIDRGLEGVGVVLHCAGPFRHTSRPMALACLRRRVHYLDITGELGVFEMLAEMDTQARAAGVMLLPGVGFDVVPSDCLALHLKQRLPTTTHLTLAIGSLGGLSRGTATTVVENLHQGGAVRRAGKIQRVPACYRTRCLDLGNGPTVVMTIPWGDISTAWYSTGIANIEVYAATSLPLRMLARLTRPFAWVLGTPLVQRRLKQRIQAGPAGPGEEERACGRTFLWGEARDDRGAHVVSRLGGPEGYTFTALTALAVIERVLGGTVEVGFQTPGKLLGADFILGIPGVERRDEKAFP